MTPLFDPGPGLGPVRRRRRYAEALPLFEQILAEDPGNLDAALRLATSHSLLGQDAQALAAFRQAAAIAPARWTCGCTSRCTTRAARSGRRRCRCCEQIVGESPIVLPGLEGWPRCASGRGGARRRIDVAPERPRACARHRRRAGRARRAGDGGGRTAAAIAAFEQARAPQGAAFRRDLELGVLYLAARRLPEARDALDRVPRRIPATPWRSSSAPR